MTNWMKRTPSLKDLPSRRGRATWAAVALIIAQLVMQVLNFLRADLAPVKESLEKITQSVARIEQRLEDHERRIKRLEDGQSQMDKPKRKEKRNEDAER